MSSPMSPAAPDLVAPGDRRPGPGRRLLFALVLVLPLVSLAAAVLAVLPGPVQPWRDQAPASDNILPALTGQRWAGQPLALDRPRLGWLEFQFATYLKRATGRLELILLRGGQTPQGDSDIVRRSLERRLIDAGVLADNALWRWDLDAALGPDPAGAYLLIRRLSGWDKSPLTLHLNSRAAPPAEILDLAAEGGLNRRPAAGGLVVVRGYGPVHSLGWLLTEPAWRWGLLLGLAALIGLLARSISRPASIWRGRFGSSGWTRTAVVIFFLSGPVVLGFVSFF